jgi:hypothetical protein
MTAPKDYPTGRPPGRPSRMSPTVVKALLDSIAGGAYISTACQFVGISNSTYGLWRRRGEAEIERVKALGEDAEVILQETSVNDEHKAISALDHLAQQAVPPFSDAEWPYAVFWFQVEKAQAAAEIRNLTIIQMAASGDRGAWQASAWILERTRPERYGRRERINLTGNEDGDSIVVEQKLTVENLEATIQALKAELGE